MMEKIIPKYARIPLILVVVYNFSVYFGSRLFTADKYHYDLGLAFEDKIPLVPFMVVIYFGCYLFWIVNYILATRNSKEEAVRFAAADMMGKTVCLVCFIFFPTTINRPEITGTSLWEEIVKFLYEIDAPDNLFPSIHCFVSWLCFIGVRKNPAVKSWYKIASLVMAIAVCISTLTLKQHFFVDVVVGIALAEMCYFTSGAIQKSVLAKRADKENLQ